MYFDRNSFIQHLTKQAEETGSSLGPDYGIDSAAQANEQHEKNLSDNRGTLKSLFSGAGEVQSQNTKLISGLLPKKGPQETSNALLKLAYENILRNKLK